MAPKHEGGNGRPVVGPLKVRVRSLRWWRARAYCTMCSFKQWIQAPDSFIQAVHACDQVIRPRNLCQRSNVTLWTGSRKNGRRNQQHIHLFSRKVYFVLRSGMESGNLMHRWTGIAWYQVLR